MRRLFLFLLLASPAFAAGGACPTGANYINPTSPTGALVTAASLGCTGAYYIAANGLDSNAGTTEGAPFLHAPGMTNCTSLCASASTGGSGIWLIFRGGDTWHFGNTGLSTSVGAQQWTTPNNGASGHPFAITVDPAWFAGGSFARPIFSGDNPISTAPVASCAFDFNNTNVVNLTANGFFQVDDIEASGFCADEATDPNSGVWSFDGSSAYILRTYNHGYSVPNEYTVTSVTGSGSSWTYNGSFPGCAANACTGNYTASQFTTSGGANNGTFPATASTATSLTLTNASGAAESNPGLVNASPKFDEWVMIHGRGSQAIANLTNGCMLNVFDNSDGTLGNWRTYPNGAATQEAIQSACGLVAYNVFNRLGAGIVSQTESVHDNLFHDLYQALGSVHGNLWNQNNDSAAVMPTYFYNNVFYNINEGVTAWLMSTSVDYVFNNVSWNNNNPTNCFDLGGSSQSTGLPATTAWIYNNTFDSPCNVRFLNNGSDPKWNGTANWNNNHLIGYSPQILSSVYTQDVGTTLTTTDHGNEIFQSEATANAQGYTQANAYAPTLVSNATVGAGANNTSSCPTFSPGSEMCSGIASVAEAAGQGGFVVSYPANTASVRPGSGAWNAGAYEFLDTFLNTFPTGLTITIGTQVTGGVQIKP